jgi:ABC-type bacteriocin/lantibiotic exporter with double-glycine peptidase domain
MESIKKIFFILNRDEKKKLIKIAFYLFIIFFLEVLSFGSLIPLINYMISGNLDNLFLFVLTENKKNFEIIFLTVIFSIFFLKNFFLYLSTNYNYQFSFNLKERIVSSFYSKYLNSSYEDQIRETNPIKINKITTEVNYFSNFINSFLLILSELFIVIVVSGFLIIINIHVFLILVFISIFTFLIFNFFKKKITANGVLRVKNSEEFSRVLYESLNLFKEIKIFNSFEWFEKKFQLALKKYLFYERKQALLQYCPKLYFEIISIFFLLTLFYFLNISFEDKKELFITFSVFVLSIIKITPSFQKIIYNLQNISFSIQSINKVYKELNNFRSEGENKIKKINIKLFNHLKLKNVSFRYSKENKYILKKINLTIKKNDKILIYGKSGVGKTTLLNLILGLLKPTSGDLYINENKINNYNFLFYNNLISYVPQRNFLLSKNIIDNIIFGRKFSKKKYINAIKVASINQFLEFKNSSFIGDGGSKLSGGQMQRVSIARAIYQKPEIIIFDEPTTYLDNDLKVKLINFLKTLKKTIILVSHDKSLFSVANKIVYLK